MKQFLSSSSNQEQTCFLKMHLFFLTSYKTRRKICLQKITKLQGLFKLHDTQY